jgi:uncharacterized SAM-binding protein YcdF (DUF218 family)
VRRPVRRLLKLIGILGLAGLIAYTIWLVMVLVVSLQDRRLYADGLSPRIIVTGGFGRGDTTSEALVGRRWLRAHGVPDSAIVVRGEGRSTYASMTVVAGWLRPRGLATVLLVSDPFHMCRLRFEARRTELVAYTSPTASSPISDNPNLELRYLFWEALKAPVAWVRSWRWMQEE